MGRREVPIEGKVFGRYREGIGKLLGSYWEGIGKVSARYR